VAVAACERGEVAAPLPVGLIGLGKHGARYLAHIRSDVPELRVVAVSRRDRRAGEALASELGGRFHGDPCALIADPVVRAVISVAPPRENAAIVQACVRERKPLLIEKPFATSVDDAFRLRDQLETSGVPCLMAQTLRFSGVVRAVRAVLAEIGPASEVVLGQSFEPTRLAWLDDPSSSGGGNILHTGVHMFDLLRDLTGGEVREVSCVLASVTTTRTEDSFAASMTIDPPGGDSDGTPRPLLAGVYGSRATESRSGEIRVIGRRGQIVADHVHRRIAIVRGWSETALPPPPDVPTVREVLRLFLPVAEGRLVPPVTARDGAAAVAIADACYRSAESGRRTEVRTR
jgi:myo-inositol 2-dehydrogenase / D-chiro-inositol 1-dehydrogenase